MKGARAGLRDCADLCERGGLIAIWRHDVGINLNGAHVSFFGFGEVPLGKVRISNEEGSGVVFRIEREGPRVIRDGLIVVALCEGSFARLDSSIDFRIAFMADRSIRRKQIKKIEKQTVGVYELVLTEQIF